ncbi:hypothetical protein K7432_003875 [Basidiobolus ranarum]|uniref:Uncharacterized protein n=1 Tax=Basidiobolus ranarum TaxID=34480 RepID=A0ABR2W6D9_9FUNG
MNRLTLFTGLLVGLAHLTGYTNGQFVSSGLTGPPPFNFNPPLVCPGTLLTNISYIDNMGCARIRLSDDGLFIPCCELKEKCYATCGMTKLLCEEQFRHCMYTLCPTYFTRHPDEGSPEMCAQYWGRMGGIGAYVWKLSQAKDFSCSAFESAQMRSRCNVEYTTPYGIAKRNAS